MVALCLDILFPWIKLLQLNTCTFWTWSHCIMGTSVSALWFQVSLSFQSLACRNVAFTWQMMARVLAGMPYSALGRYAEREQQLRPIWHNALSAWLVSFELLWVWGPGCHCSYCSCGNKWQAKRLLLPWIKSTFMLVIQKILLLC